MVGRIPVMTRAVKLRALTTLALLAIVLATASAVTILRLKNNRCGTCVAERSDLNSPKLWQREVWVLGFLSGMAAMQSGTDCLDGLDEDAVYVCLRPWKMARQVCP